MGEGRKERGKAVDCREDGGGRRGKEEARKEKREEKRDEGRKKGEGKSEKRGRRRSIADMCDSHCQRRTLFVLLHTQNREALVSSVNRLSNECPP